MGDFGLATKLVQDSERKRTICGTPNYIAPEILEGTAGHSYQVSLGCLFSFIEPILRCYGTPFSSLAGVVSKFQ